MPGTDDQVIYGTADVEPNCIKQKTVNTNYHYYNGIHYAVLKSSVVRCALSLLFLSNIGHDNT